MDRICPERQPGWKTTSAAFWAINDRRGYASPPASSRRAEGIPEDHGAGPTPWVSLGSRILESACGLPDRGGFETEPSAGERVVNGRQRASSEEGALI